MYIEFKTSKLKKCCEDDKFRKRTWSKAIGNKLVQRLNEMQAVATLSMLKKIKSADCHRLSGERKGQYAVKLTGNYRLIFEPVIESNMSIDEIDETGIARVIIIEVVDYH